MPIRVHKPTTPGRRKSSAQDFSDITKNTPEKSLVEYLHPNAGRNNSGSITVRHQGGGEKQLYRLVDFKRMRYDMPAKVAAIEYDPNRGPRLALLEYGDKEKAYMIAPEGLKVGDAVVSSAGKVEATVGSRMPLKHIPVGLFVHCVELTPGKGGQLVRGAGGAAQLQVFEGEYAQLQLPSGEVRMVSVDCMATVGRVGNPDYQLVRYGKAGRMRHRGIRPRVKGKNMNPNDHPHGGGEGHSPIGLKGGPKTPWGKKAMGVKTRKHNKWSEKFIVSRRKRRIE